MATNSSSRLGQPGAASNLEKQMGMTNGRTICSKHDEILELSELIFQQAEGVKYYDFTEQASLTLLENEEDHLASLLKTDPILQKVFKGFADSAGKIYFLAEAAKKDGQSMENGLGDKRIKMREVLQRIKDLEAATEDALSRVKYLESLLENPIA
jgi:hypothetical protein